MSRNSHHMFIKMLRSSLDVLLELKFLPNKVMNWVMNKGAWTQLHLMATLRSGATRKPSQKTEVSCDFPYTAWQGAMPDSTSNSPRDASTIWKPDHLEEGHSALLLE